jgi:hypothetical protein
MGRQKRDGNLSPHQNKLIQDSEGKKWIPSSILKQRKDKLC